MIRNTHTSWGAPARLLHWATAGVILFCLGLGIYMTQWVTDALAQFPLIQTHKSWGFVAFVLAGLRIVWRLMNRAPDMPDHMLAHERLTAHLGHLALYALMLIMPLSGWLMASASPLQDTFGIKNKVFDLFEMYDPFVPGDKALSELFATVHFYAAWALVAVLIGHIGAALYHHLYHKDDVLKRMSFGRFDT
ncbi:cytochrome b [Aliiroseovarius crassostreae]|uniref:cytochrome b n=1 Tax=Aliiroseovarius crassostreae TaxID=154981 RepID=UPI00220A3E31|nr:cytochrome b [Aliiroseovarius crassostreae]UWQ07298.1 cytochrome b [Aliiroseovarius crassostreae]